MSQMNLPQHADMTQSQPIYQKILDSLGTIQSEVKRLSVRQNNSHCVLANDYVEPIFLEDGTIPEHFPLSLQAFDNLNAEQCDIILKAYNLDSTGSIGVCKRRLGRFLGVPYYR